MGWSRGLERGATRSYGAARVGSAEQPRCARCVRRSLRASPSRGLGEVGAQSSAKGGCTPLQLDGQPLPRLQSRLRLLLRPQHPHLPRSRRREDFDRQIIVKINIGDVLARELRRPTWTHEPVALGTNTDPYQRAEGRYRLMPGIIAALAGSGTPFSILTKGTTARGICRCWPWRARPFLVSMGVSIALTDETIHAALEPGTPTPRARLELVRAIVEAGLPARCWWRRSCR